MKYLILIRHGEYERDALTTFGKSQITKTAELLAPLCDGLKIVIVPSKMRRAAESAQILGEVLGVSPQESRRGLAPMGPVLEADQAELIEALLDEFRGSYDVVIFVTHEPQAVDFPPIFSKKEWGLEIERRGVRTGQALLIDCKTKAISKIG